jgi:hypothetical protein
MLMSAPAGRWSAVVSPAWFPTTRVVSSVLYFGMTGTWNYFNDHRLWHGDICDHDVRVGTSSMFHIKCWMEGNSVVVPIMLQGTHAVTRLSLGTSSYILKPNLARYLEQRNLVYSPADGRPEESLECVGTKLPVLLGAPRAC